MNLLSWLFPPKVEVGSRWIDRQTDPNDPFCEKRYVMVQDVKCGYVLFSWMFWTHTNKLWVSDQTRSLPVRKFADRFILDRPFRGSEYQQGDEHEA